MIGSIRCWWRGRWADWTMAGLAVGLSLALYLATLSPGLSYLSPDGNELIVVCATLGLAHSTGYPLYTWLGKLFSLLPLGTVAYRVNLMSAVLGALGVVLLYGIVRLLTGRHGPAPFAGKGQETPPAQDAIPLAAGLFAALFFAFSRAFWSQTIITEVYAANLFMLALTLLLFLLWARQNKASVPHSDWVLLLAVLSLSLSVGAHMSNLGFVPVYGLFVLLVYPRVWRRPWLILGAALALGLGLLQFLWLPFKSYNLTDAMMLRNSPTTWEGFYNYTLGAFPQMKFAFSLPEIPERIVLYLELLRQNVGLAGILAGLYGLGELLWRRTAHFYLLMGMYLIHVIFFIQYRVFDLDVFFIPAHFFYVIAIGYGAACGLGYLERWLGRPDRRLLRVALNGLVALLLVGAVVSQAVGNYAWNDRSGDTAAEDFYENAFELLPEGSILLGQGGVFGYDMFYYRLVEDPRPDVHIPLLDGPQVRWEELRGAELYSTLRAQGGRRGPGGLDPRLIPESSWYVPVLVGESGTGATGMPRRELVLYRVSAEPPELVVVEADPQVWVRADLDGLRLLGYDLEETLLDAGGRLHLTLYWRVTGRPRGMLATALGEQTLEAHPLGFGNLERYLQEVQPPQGGVIVEDYYLVVPSDMPAGTYPLRVGVVVPHSGGEARGNWVDVGEVEVTR